ncbi:hypothetical protein ACHAWF_004323 [Thalassiosira exigua]
MTMDRSSHLWQRRVRGHHRVLAALAFLAANEKSTALLLRFQNTDGGRCSPTQTRHELMRFHRRRTRFEMHVQSSLTLKHESTTIGWTPRRLSTSLFLSEDSSASAHNEDNDAEKKSGDGSGSGSSPKPKSNKGNGSPSPPGVAKGASASDNNISSDRKSSKAKRPPRRTKKSNNKRQQDRTAPPKTGSKHGTSMLESNKGKVTTTSDENYSIKGFKSERKLASPQQAGTRPTNNITVQDGEEGDDIRKRVVQLEMIVSSQMAEIQRLRREIDDLTKASGVFANVVDVLREAGLRIDEDEEVVVIDEEMEDDIGGDDNASTKRPLQQKTIRDDMEIFGIAPTSVTDAADAAGASILSAILAGKHRMLVDVRDAELTRDPKLLVEFIELAILPVAAGLEGMDGDEYVRNRVKLVFPTVKDLMSYRRSMALAAPEVVSLSTLGFDPVDERDNLIVVIAPSPDDMAGVNAMEKLMARSQKTYVEPALRITQPIVVLNHHMVPIDMAGFGKFTSVYHLRLLSVQYMTGDSTPDYVAKEATDAKPTSESGDSLDSLENEILKGDSNLNSTNMDAKGNDDEEDAALEAAMTHAHEIGVHQGVTRAMIIRAYPKPWHVFVDTSPDTDADFEVAATFDIEPTSDDVNFAIVECLEGSEREDEIVAQQMQAALEAGQLNRVSNMLGISPTDIVSEDKSSLSDSDADDKSDNTNPFGEYDGNDWDDLYYDDWFSEDSV